jgi:hypothetical protein
MEYSAIGCVRIAVGAVMAPSQEVSNRAEPDQFGKPMGLITPWVFAFKAVDW